MTLQKHKISTDEYEKKSIGEQLKKYSPNIITDIVINMLTLCIPVVGNALGTALLKIINELRKRRIET